MKSTRLAVIGSALAAGMMSMVAANPIRISPERDYPGFPKEGKSRPKNKGSGSKLLHAAMGGTLGMGRHTNSKHPIDSVTFSPKRDIGKGPQFTRSVRGISKGYINQEMQRTQQARNHANTWIALPVSHRKSTIATL